MRASFFECLFKPKRHVENLTEAIDAVRGGNGNDFPMLFELECRWCLPLVNCQRRAYATQSRYSIAVHDAERYRPRISYFNPRINRSGTGAI